MGDRLTNYELFTKLRLTSIGHMHDGKIHIACPSCGKRPKPNQTHCIVDERGLHCFVCNFSMSLYQLCVNEGLIGGDKVEIETRVIEQPEEAKVDTGAWWKAMWPKILERYLANSDKYKLWYNYKGVLPETVDKYQLGIGMVPASNGKWWSGTRLIVPVIRDGVMVGIHGRAIGEHSVKWAAASGSDKKALWMETCKGAKLVAIMENYVDALLLKQLHPDLGVMALGSARVLHDEEMAVLQEAKPELTIMMLDNDLVGQANEPTKRYLIKQWEVKNPGKRCPVVLNGIRNVNMLTKNRLKSIAFPWPKDAPPKADPGWMLEQDRKFLMAAF